MPGRSQYAACKAALVALARSWAAEVVGAGVTVTPDYKAGTLIFQATNPGTYYLQYLVSNGPSAATGLIRVDVVARDPDGLDPIAGRDTALVPERREVLVDVLDYNLPLAQAQAQGRFHHQLLPDNVIYYEASRFPPEVADNLRARGWTMQDGLGGGGAIEAIQIVGNTPVPVSDPRNAVALSLTVPAQPAKATSAAAPAPAREPAEAL